MMIFFKERLAYLAVPKTGTSAMERALGTKASAIVRDPPGLKHTNAIGFETKFRKIFERGNLDPMETMAVIREPLDWLGSWFRYRQRPALSGHVNSTAGLSFDDFVQAYLSDDVPPFANIGSQGRFVTDRDDQLLVNHLFSYADLAAAKRFLERRLDTSFELKTVNRSPQQDATLALSSENDARLREVCALDFQIYDALRDGPLSVS